MHLDARWLRSLLATLALVSGCSDEVTPLDATVPPDGQASFDGGGGDDGGGGPVCGDGTRTRPEVCDDGNVASGDGCSADCTSDESCGNSLLDLDAGELCDDGNTIDGDGCRGDCRSDYRCGNGVVDTVASGATTDEVCDDGNTANGDGCSAACDSTEACGNGIVDLGAGEACDDGNTIDGDLCSADCRTSALCGNGRVEDVEECDDGNSVDGDGCSAGCTVERCGNGRLDPGEACDDGNAVEEDGCRSDCAFTCSVDADCRDGNPCNGDEVCVDGGSAASRCSSGPPPANGTACADGRVCTAAGTCLPSTCGDGLLDARTEQCDDGNGANGDGCDADCTFTCSADADCADPDVCNGVETCVNPGTIASVCRAGTPTANGTACGSGLVCNGGACVAGVCGDGFLTTGEACDDGNATNGDGCDADCTFTCSAAIDCDDGNPCNGAEVCTGGGTLASRCGAGTPPASGTTCGGGRVCIAGACVPPGCGDGVRSGTEQCDDGNATNGDGCDADCTWTCATAADCADGNVCNGAESCTNASTLASRCRAGTAAANGTTCGGANICLAGACVAPRCGDAVRSGTEQCDDGNATNGDGCDADCTWTCSGAADCTDGNVCNGAEVCSNASTLLSRCAAGTPAADGTACDLDATPTTRDVCRASACTASRCGDGYIDLGATPPEQCDDGNTTGGDGCSATCQREASATPPTAFRITNLDLVSPRVTVVPLIGCADVTQTPVAGFSVNGSLDTAIGPTTAGGDYSLHFVEIFRPFSTSAATTPMELQTNPTCMEAPTPDACGPAATPDGLMTTATNTAMGTCFSPVAADVNTRAGTPAAYAPTANTVTGPCFITAPSTLTIRISGIPIPLRSARIAATYSGTTAGARRLVSGVVTGFLPEREAADVILPSTLPLVGGTPLYSHLQAGNRSVMNSAGMTIPDGCNVGFGTNEDDADTLPDGTRGFWFFLNFTAEEITWSGP